MPRIITDIDGTVLDNGQPVQAVIDYIKAEAEEVVVLTNRPESSRASTIQDLKSIGLSYDQLIMNTDGSPSAEFKAGAVKAMLDAGLEIDEFIDNDAGNRAAVEALGVEVLDPADIVSGAEAEEDDMEEYTPDNPAAFDRSSKFKKTMSKLTPEAELNDLRVAAAALLSERDDLRATVEKLTVGAADELTAAKADIVAKDARIAELTAELEKLQAASAAVQEQAAAVKASVESAAKQAADIVASTGIDPVAVVPAANEPAAKVDHLAAFMGMAPGKERDTYFKAHKADIVRGLRF
jgi:ribonucleotide monophosphatase NagD (HAD superfamily)